MFSSTSTVAYPCSPLLGFDLSSAYDLVVPGKGKAIVKTDLSIAIPQNTYARIGIVTTLTVPSVSFTFPFSNHNLFLL